MLIRKKLQINFFENCKKKNSKPMVKYVIDNYVISANLD